MSRKTAEDLVNSPKVQKYINSIDKDTSAALSLAKTVIGSDMTRYYPSGVLSEYKSDAARLDKAQGQFNAAWNKVVFKKAKSSKEIIKTYSQYVLALEILETANAKHAAMMTSGFALVAAAFSQGAITWAQEMKKRSKALYDELMALKKLLTSAELDEIGAYAQAGINVALTAVTLCLGPAGWAARIGLWVGSIGAHMLVDAALGPSRGSIVGTSNTVISESSQLVDKFSKGGKRLAGGAAAVVTLKLDIDEIGEAEKIIKEIRKRIRVVEQEWKNVTLSAIRWNKQIGKWQKQLDSALKAYDSAASKFKSSQRKREELLKEFKQWK